MLVRSVSHFTLGEEYFLWSTENIFGLTKIFSCPRHSKLEKKLFGKRFYAQTNGALDSEITIHQF